ncbi:MAG: diguanylate cyclase [Sulfurimonas sp.]|nr:MAG: diguanylate cyclase [Sulfurimonas sp.]
MPLSKYIIINKDILVEGHTFDFDIYLPSKSKKEISCFKQKGSVVTFDDQSVMKVTKAFYVNEADKHSYELFYKTYLSSIEEVQALEYINIDDNTSIIYKRATKIIEKLYKEPYALGNYEEAKEVVNDLVSTILDDEFTIKSLMSIVAHNFYTHTHSLNVAIYSISLGAYLGLRKDTLKELGEVALLHDLGKNKIDANIINKKGILTPTEFTYMKKHSLHGYIIAIEIGITNKNTLDGIKHHHEKMDGTGYPSGLKGKDIPLFARIVCICDIFDGLVSKKSYKDAMTTFDSLKLMKIEMKNDIDMDLLNKMIMMFR